jgi:hypothetical protein
MPGRLFEVIITKANDHRWQSAWADQKTAETVAQSIEWFLDPDETIRIDHVTRSGRVQVWPVGEKPAGSV